MNKDTYQKLQLFHFANEIKGTSVKKKMRCVLFGNFGASNVGDEAILAGELNELKKIPNLTVTVVAKFPKEIKRLHEVPGISLYSLGTIRREIKKANFVIVGGGGLINKHERSLIGFFYQLYMLFVFFFLPQFYKKKLYVLGIGVYSNTNSFIVQTAKILLKSAVLVTVRDQHSYDFLKKKNIRVSYFKDNSFLMDLVPVKKVLQDPYFRRLYNNNRMNIGISLVKPENKNQEKQLISEITTFIANNRTVADFWFYSADYHPAYFNDEKFGHVLHEAVKKKVGQDVHFHFIPTSWTPQMFFSSFKLMNFIIAMRLHTSIFAYRNGISFIGITYDKKCASFLKSIGKTPYAIQQVTSKIIQEHFV